MCVEVDVGLIGLSLAYSVSLAGMFQYGVRMSAEVENLVGLLESILLCVCSYSGLCLYTFIASSVSLQMISAERLMAYGKLPPEAPLETPSGVSKPPNDWPAHGSVSVRGMKYRYSVDSPYVLKGVSFDIQPQEKVN